MTKPTKESASAVIGVALRAAYPEAEIAVNDGEFLVCEPGATEGLHIIVRNTRPAKKKAANQ